MGGNNLYFRELPTKWISNDGLTMWLVFSGFGSDPIAKDAYQHMKLKLSLGDSTPPDVIAPAAPGNLTVSP